MTGWDLLPAVGRIAWAAGYFDARGSVTACNGRPRLAVKSSEGELVRRFAVVVECGKIFGPYGHASMEKRDGSPRQDSTLWIAEGEAFLAAAALLAPYLLRPLHLERLRNHVETLEAVRPQEPFSGASTSNRGSS